MFEKYCSFIMGKEYDFHYHHAGDGCQSGSMICVCCNKGIDENTDDWVESKKTVDRWGDWGYRSRHRSCVKNQNGWMTIEKSRDKYRKKVIELAEYLNKYKDSNGNFSNVLYEALEEIGIET